MSDFIDITWARIAVPLVTACGILVVSVILQRRSKCLPSILMILGAVISLGGVMLESFYLARFELSEDNSWVLEPMIPKIVISADVGRMLGQAIFVFGFLMFTLAYRNPKTLLKNLSEQVEASDSQPFS